MFYFNFFFLYSFIKFLFLVISIFNVVYSILISSLRIHKAYVKIIHKNSRNLNVNNAYIRNKKKKTNKRKIQFTKIKTTKNNKTQIYFYSQLVYLIWSLVNFFYFSSISIVVCVRRRHFLHKRKKNIFVVLCAVCRTPET